MSSERKKHWNELNLHMNVNLLHVHRTTAWFGLVEISVFSPIRRVKICRFSSLSDWYTKCSNIIVSLLLFMHVSNILHSDENIQTRKKQTSIYLSQTFRLYHPIRNTPRFVLQITVYWISIVCKQTLCVYRKWRRMCVFALISCNSLVTAWFASSNDCPDIAKIIFWWKKMSKK